MASLLQPKLTPTASSQPTVSQAANLPEIRQVPIPAISKLEKDGNFSKWSENVHSALKPIGIDNLISTLPRPGVNDTEYTRWRVWSVTVRSWLFGQMTNDMLDYVLVFYRQQGEKGPLPRYADEMFHLIELASNAISGVHHLAIASFWSMHRASFPSPGEYIKEWITVVERLRSLDHPITTYMATEIMCVELEEEMPVAVRKFRAKMQRKESSLSNEELPGLCQSLLSECTCKHVL